MFQSIFGHFQFLHTFHIFWQHCTCQHFHDRSLTMSNITVTICLRLNEILQNMGDDHLDWSATHYMTNSAIKEALTLHQISLWHSCGYGWPLNWCPNPRSSRQSPIAPQSDRSNHKKINISKTTGPISTIFGHKLGDIQEQILWTGQP